MLGPKDTQLAETPVPDIKLLTANCGSNIVLLVS